MPASGRRAIYPNIRIVLSNHFRAVWSVLVVHMKKLCICGHPKCAQWRFWSDCANAQADLNLRWAHTSEGTLSEVATHIMISAAIWRKPRQVQATNEKQRPWSYWAKVQAVQGLYLLQLFFVCASVFFFNIRRLFCPCLFLTSYSVSASVRPLFVIVTFSLSLK